jgi:site-specific DNA recombinase
VNAAIYVRISQDRAGAGLGVARQEEDCRALCERLGWEVVGVYSDNDVSAYSGKPRPAWNSLIADVESGSVGAIAVWHVDRLTRHPMELEYVVELADKYGLKLATVAGEIDLATPSGQFAARVMGASARQEAMHKSERQRRQRRQSAEAGKPNGGGTRPYGYEEDRITVNRDEAKVIKEAAKRALAGESLSSICRDFGLRGITTPTGGTWQPRTLRRLLASARISGRREHKPWSSSQKGTKPLVGDIVSDAVWRGVISVADSDRLRLLLNDAGRRKKYGAVGRAPSYLLTGVLFCSRCGGRMRGQPRSGVRRYVCWHQPGDPVRCSTATNTSRTDELVRDLVLVALASPGLAERLRATSDADPQLPVDIRADEEQLEELAKAWANGEVTRGEWSVAREIIEARLTRNRRELSRVTTTAPIEAMVGNYDDLFKRWARMNVSQQRAVVTTVLERVDVNPANPRKKWDPERFDPVWRF